MTWLQLNENQIKAVKKMKNGCILKGGVGSGKSRTGLAKYYVDNGGDIDSEKYVPMDDPPQDLYIITTAKKRDALEWESEMVPFLIAPNGVDMYYHKVVVDSWNNVSKYTNIKEAYFIFDEQKAIGNGTWAKSFLKITKVNNWIMLSATPGDT